MNTFGSITYEFFNNKKNYHFDLTGAFSNIIEESEAIEYDRTRRISSFHF